MITEKLCVLTGGIGEHSFPFHECERLRIASTQLAWQATSCVEHFLALEMSSFTSDTQPAFDYVLAYVMNTR
jgi:hypothetical protein